MNLRVFLLALLLVAWLFAAAAAAPRASSADQRPVAVQMMRTPTPLAFVTNTPAPTRTPEVTARPIRLRIVISVSVCVGQACE